MKQGGSVLRAGWLLAALLLVTVPHADAQLRPLDPVGLEGFFGDAVHADIGVARLSDQRVSLAGTRGTLLEAGNFHFTVRSGRVLFEAGGTLQRFSSDEEVLEPPTGDAVPPTSDRKRHDSGDYRVGAVFMLSGADAFALTALRVGTRLPTTDNRVGLDRDATDFFTTISAQRSVGLVRLTGEAGLSINTTRRDNYEQSDVLIYALTVEGRMGPFTPYLTALGQEDMHEWRLRGNEDLGELRAGLRAGRRAWLSAALIVGYSTFSPRSGIQLSAGTSF